MDDDPYDYDEDYYFRSRFGEYDFTSDSPRRKRARRCPPQSSSLSMGSSMEQDNHDSNCWNQGSSVDPGQSSSHGGSCENNYAATSEDEHSDSSSESSDEDRPEEIEYTEEDLLPMDIPEEISCDSQEDSRFLWIDQPSAVLSFADIQRNYETIRDCGFIVHDNEIKAHSCVVTAFSQFCNNLFQVVFHRHPKFKCISIVLECDYEVLKLIMDCMYSGAINVRREKRGEFLRILRNLQAQNICEITNGVQTTVDTLSGDIPHMPFDVRGRFSISPISFPFHPPNDVRSNLRMRGRSGSSLRVVKNQFICPVVIRTRNSPLLHVEEYVLKQNQLTGYKAIKIRSTSLRKSHHKQIIEKRPSNSIIRLA